jgi:hypothetical protein
MTVRSTNRNVSKDNLKEYELKPTLYMIGTPAVCIVSLQVHKIIKSGVKKCAYLGNVNL